MISEGHVVAGYPAFALLCLGFSILYSDCSAQVHLKKNCPFNDTQSAAEKEQAIDEWLLQGRLREVFNCGQYVAQERDTEGDDEDQHFPISSKFSFLILIANQARD